MNDTLFVVLCVWARYMCRVQTEIMDKFSDKTKRACV